jgi:L-galactose dehydrogenase
MEYREFGNTGLRVSALGYGGSPLGGVFREIDESEGIRAVHLALDHGINLIDTAPYYGAARAETVLGRALRGVARDRYILATKVGRYGADEFDFSAARVVRSVEESLGRLGVDHIDLLQVHDIEFGSVRQVIDETLPALRRVRDSGKARFIGVTGLHLHLFTQVTAETPVDFVQSYCHGTLYDQTIAEWLANRAPRSLGCINSAPLGMGLLTDRGPPAWHPAPERLRAACAAAAAHCRSHGVSVSEIALYESAHLPGVHTTIVGMARPENVLANLRALATQPDPSLLAEVRQILAPAQNVSWPSGRPENQPCA